jgi:hypothetical protein
LELPEARLHHYKSQSDIQSYQALRRFGAGQQFIISKELIHNRPLQFYQDILDWFPDNFLLPWHLERIWEYIFKV